MSYYNGRQVFIFCVASVGFTLMLTFAFGLWQINTPEPGQAVSGTAKNQTGAATLPLELQASDQAAISIANSNGYSDDEQNNIDIYATYSEAVVNISTEVINYDVFFEAIPGKGSTGSGAIIDKRGYILTNNHVIEDAVKLFVTLAGGDRLEARVVGRDPENDLAVIKIEPGERMLRTINLGTSGNLKVGQKVIAIGNPFSFDRTMTTGIVSALGRPIRTDKNLIIQGMIQTDASINPGNSGGPLLDREGNLIGINTMIYTESGGSVGLGFAVPVDTAKRIIPEIIKYGQVKRGWIDITPIQLFPQLVQYARMPVSEGILVSKVESGSRAEKAGIKGGSQDKAVRYGRTIIYLGGDIIQEVDGVACASIADLYTALEDNKPGDTVKVVVLRGNKKIELQVNLSERPSSYSRN